MKNKIINNKNKLNKKTTEFNLENLNSVDAADVIKTVIQSRIDYEKTREEEHTKRVKIEKSADIQIKKIESNQQMIENISDRIFNQRQDAIDKNFNVLERALDTDKDDIAIKAMESISNIVKESPLKDFDTISNALKDDKSDFSL